MSRLIYRAAAIATVLVASIADGKIFLHESFDSDSDSAWTASTAKSDAGAMKLSSGDFHGDKAINQGYKTSEDAKFYATSRKTEPVTNEGKDFVVSLSVKHEQGLDCGGGYVKLFHDTEATAFDGDTAYHLMFGPDQCGSSKKVHIIFNYKGENLLWKKEPRYPDDKLTHVYTVVVHPDNTYEFYLDQEKKESGKLEEDWAFLAPKEIDDAEDKKPESWVDDAQMADPEDTKPEGHDDEPKEIADPNAEKPDDWDTEEDGEWEAPMVPNPKFKGEWSPKMIPNPEYKGVWAPKQVPNPKYQPDEELYKIQKPIEHVGIDVWQVKSGSIFDNIIIGDSLDEVNAIVDQTWKATKDAEKKALDDKEAAAKPAEEAPQDADEEANDDL
jgi:calreticulin